MASRPASAWIRCVRGLVLGFLAAGLVGVAPGTAEASGIGSVRLSVDFTKPEEAASMARWSLPDRIRCGPEGLGFEGPETSSYDFQVLVTRPLPVGRVGWAATNAGVGAKVHWTGPAADKVHGRLFLRRSTDAEHWTAWSEVPSVGASDATHEHRTRLSVPRATLEEWTRLRARHRQEAGDAPLERSDRAVAAAVERERPGWLAREQPFLGYLQFLYEAGIPGGHALRRIDVQASYVVPGPDVPAGRGEAHEPWDFRTGPDALRLGTPEGEMAARDVLGAALRALVAEAPGGGADRAAPVERLTLVDQTAVGPYPYALDVGALPALDAAPAGLREDFARRNAESRPLPPHVDAGVPIGSTSRYAATYLVEGGRIGREDPYAWQTFHGREPGSLGLVWVSEPAFSDDGNHALVHVGVAWGLTSGAGRRYVLTLAGGAWTVAASHPTWTR
jgi:hypothetical protein